MSRSVGTGYGDNANETVNLLIDYLIPGSLNYSTFLSLYVTVIRAFAIPLTSISSPGIVPSRVPPDTIDAKGFFGAKGFLAGPTVYEYVMVYYPNYAGIDTVLPAVDEP